MYLTKLGSVALGLAHKNVIMQRLPVHGWKTLFRFQSDKSTGSGKIDDPDDIDQPIKYSTSKAATWDPTISRTGSSEKQPPWCQHWLVMASTASILIYFCILREENDIDEKLTWELSDHFQGEKRANLEASQRIFTNLQKSYSPK